MADDLSNAIMTAGAKGNFAGPNAYNLPIKREQVRASIWLVDLSNPKNKLRLQTVPESLKVDPQTKLIAISSPGRNNPFYHYTGAEDILEFDISWYANTENRRDVISNCKWLEAMTKNDGYKGKIRKLGLIWDSEYDENGFKRLYEFTTWLVKSASYELKLFHGSYSMMPTLATQKVVLVKTTSINQSQQRLLDFAY